MVAELLNYSLVGKAAQCTVKGGSGYYRRYEGCPRKKSSKKFWRNSRSNNTDKQMNNSVDKTYSLSKASIGLFQTEPCT
jgi:hypothetical protein